MSTFQLPQTATLGSGQRVSVTDVRATDIVFNLLGSAPAEGQPETVVAGGHGQATYGATFTTFAEVIAFLDNPPPAQKTEAEIWAEFLAGSIHDETTGIYLKANRQARNDFAAQATLMGLAIGAGKLALSDNVEIWDTTNQKHTMSAADCLALLLRYGFAWQQAFGELAP